MGCLPSRSVQELTEDTALEVLHAFLETNEIIFQDCYLGMNPCFKRSVFDFMEFSDFKNLVDPVLLTQFLGDCLWTNRSSPDLIEDLASLLPLLETRNNIAYEILRILWYLCNDALPEEVKRTGWLQRVQERPLTSGQFNEVAVYKGGYQFACHFLASAILGKISHFGAGYIQELLRVYLDTQLPDAVTAVLVYWSKFPQKFEPIIFTQAAILEMSHEQFQLYLEIVAFYPTLECPMETICSRFETVGMAIPLKLASYLEQSTRLIAFVTYFRKRPGPLLQQALPFVLQAMKTISLKEETPFDTLAAVLTVLNVENLPQNVVLCCQDELKELFDLQFAHCQINLPFSEAYLQHTSLPSQDSFKIGEKIRELVFFTTIETAYQENRLCRLVDYLRLLLQDCSSVDLHILTEDTIDLMLKCIELFPHLVGSILKSANSAVEILHGKQANVTGVELAAIGNTLMSLNKLIMKLNHHYAPETPAPLDLMSMIERYTKCILPSDKSMPDRPTLKAIAKECWELSNGFDHRALSQAEYDDDSKFTTIVWCLMRRHAKKLSKGIPKRWQTPGYRQKWQNHAFLVQEFSRFALFRLLFRTDQDLLLRRTILAFFISNFQKKKELDHDNSMKDRLLNDKLTTIRLALSNSFQLPSTSSQMIETVLTSECLKTALETMGVATNRNLYMSYQRKIFFTDLGPDTFGLTIFGGYISLNKDYLSKGNIGQYLLMVTLSHEIAHAERRFSKDGTVNVEANSPLEKRLARGIPGKPALVKSFVREGGSALEFRLFGVRVTFVSQSQIDFLTKSSSWKMKLSTFKGTLAYLGRSVKPGDIYPLARQSSKFYYFGPRRSCHARG